MKNREGYAEGDRRRTFLVRRGWPSAYAMPRVAVGLTDGTVSASFVLPACATRPLATPRAATTPRVTVGVVYATPTAWLRRGLASWAGLVRCYADGPDVWPSA